MVLDVKTPADFLKAIGRSSETKLAIESWNEFWNSSGLTLKGMGVSAPQDRKFVLDHLRPNSDNSINNKLLDTYYGAWRDTARDLRSKILPMIQDHRRRSEGQKDELLRFEVLLMLCM
jgi:IGR protein motif